MHAGWILVAVLGSVAWLVAEVAKVVAAKLLRRLQLGFASTLWSLLARLSCPSFLKDHADSVGPRK